MTCFSGKKALIIGGSGGIGRALSLQLAASGASLVVHGGHDSADFDNFILKLQQISNAAGNSDSVQKLVIHFTTEEFAALCSQKLNLVLKTADIVCVCFGPFVQKAITDTTLNDWQAMSLLDYALPGFCVSAVLPGMIEKKWGRILLFGGTRTYSINGYKTNAAYAGAKTGVCSLVRSVAAGYADCGITCNAILPGFTDTEYVLPEIKKNLADRMPCKKLISTKTVADAGMFLLGSQEVNGVLLNVDSGWNNTMSSI